MQARDRWATLYEASAGFSRSWLLTLAVLGGLVYPLSVALYYNNIGRQPDADWVRHLFLRKEAAIELAGSAPRVLIVGGSGCLFSLEAEVLERELAQPVINLCSHAGVGLEYMLARARRHARSGDTVVLALEYRVMNFPDSTQSNVEWNYFTSWDRRHYLEHGIPEAFRMIYRIPFGEIQKSQEGWQKLHDGYRDQLYYDVTSMTPAGNLHESMGHKTPMSGRIELQFHMPSEYARQLVSGFAQWAKRKGIRVVAAYQAAALEPKEAWRKTEFFGKIPGWWKEAGIEPQGTPDQATWLPFYFMDTIHHGGPGVAYQNAVRVAAAMQGKPLEAPGKVLLLPAHPARSVLPFPARNGAAVELYMPDDPDADVRLKSHLGAGHSVVAATAALGNQLRAKGYSVKPIIEEYTTPSQVLAANRERIVILCARPDAPAGFALDSARAGQAWAGVWQSGSWTLQSGAATAALTLAPFAPMATGEPMAYRLQILATATNCEIQVFERERYPSTASVRMMVIDPARGIVTNLYEFGPDLKAEVRWQGEVTAP